LIRGQAEADIVQDLEIKIHEITFAIDTHTYVRAGFENKVKPINKRVAHKDMLMEAT